MEKYSAVEFWRNDIAMPNTAHVLDTMKHLEYLTKNVEGCKKVLDFGSGKGRLFPAYKGTEFVQCYDITDQHLWHLNNMAELFGVNFELKVVEGVGPLPYTDKEFDVAVAVAVLMHNVEDDVELYVNELGRVAKKVVMINWFDPKLKLGYHPPVCFNHDYFNVVVKGGFTVKDWVFDRCVGGEGQLYMVYGGSE